jgi:hypothetical protein
MISLNRYRPTAAGDLVRLGRDQDGGYLINRSALEAARVLISGGINDDWSFEEDFTKERPQAQIIAFDGSVGLMPFFGRAIRQLGAAAYRSSRLEWDKAAVRLGKSWRFVQCALSFTQFWRKNRRFEAKFLGDKDSVGWVGMDGLLQRWESAAGLPEILLKIDIEGSEYQIVPAIAAHHRAVCGVVLEWHDLAVHWEQFEELMESLLAEFVVAHIHGNNHRPLIDGTTVPSVIEMTLLNKQLIGPDQEVAQADYPLELDCPCDPRRDDYRLTFS